MVLKLKELRQSAGISQTRLCRRVPGLSRYKLSLIENELYELPISTLESIRAAIKAIADEKHLRLTDLIQQDSIPNLKKGGPMK